MSSIEAGNISSIQGAKQLPNAAYGEQKEFQDMQAGAPMAKTPTPQMPQINPMAGIVPLTAPTQRPDEPVTANGANLSPTVFMFFPCVK